MRLSGKDLVTQPKFYRDMVYTAGGEAGKLPIFVCLFNVLPYESNAAKTKQKEIFLHFDPFWGLKKKKK